METAAAGDDRETSVSIKCPGQYSVSLCLCLLSRDRPDRLEVSESQGHHSKEGWWHSSRHCPTHNTDIHNKMVTIHLLIVQGSFKPTATYSKPHKSLGNEKKRQFKVLYNTIHNKGS